MAQIVNRNMNVEALHRLLLGCQWTGERNGRISPAAVLHQEIQQVAHAGMTNGV
jgi:hypothetical protein